MAKKVLVAMSGGVDSSVAALLLKRQGYEVIGVTLKLWDYEGEQQSRTCCSIDDVSDARGVANKLNIPHHVFNFKRQFEDQVISRFIDTYLTGATPNPCIDCNRYIKFGELFRRADLLGADCIATGHYARVQLIGERYALLRGLDEGKDQSYVLYNLTQSQLARTLLPLGELTKPQVRELAQEMGLLNAKKPDSQEICFVPGNDYAAFIERNAKQLPEGGDFIDTSGRVIGAHAGIHRYTIGQRKGLGAFSKPMYVVRKDVNSGAITLGEAGDLLTSEFAVGDLNWISLACGANGCGDLHAAVKSRYSAPMAPCVLSPLREDQVLVRTQAPVRAVTPGQAAVFYDGDMVLGGGTIV